MSDLLPCGEPKYVFLKRRHTQDWGRNTCKAMPLLSYPLPYH